MHLTNPVILIHQSFCLDFLKSYCSEIPAYELLKVNNQTLNFETIKKHNVN